MHILSHAASATPASLVQPAVGSSIHNALSSTFHFAKQPFCFPRPPLQHRGGASAGGAGRPGLLPAARAGGTQLGASGLLLSRCSVFEWVIERLPRWVVTSPTQWAKVRPKCATIWPAHGIPLLITPQTALNRCRAAWRRGWTSLPAPSCAACASGALGVACFRLETTGAADTQCAWEGAHARLGSASS